MPLLRFSFITLALVIPAISAAGGSILIRLTVHGEPSQHAQLKGTLRAEPDGADGAERVREWEVEAPWEGPLDLDASFRWRLSLHFDGYWDPPTVVRATEDSKLVEIPLISAGTLTGRLRTTDNQPLPKVVSLRFQSSPATERNGGALPIPEVVIACPVEEDRWTCEVPGGELDLKVQATEFMPHYFWGVEARAHETTDLGVLTLERGASLVGWVESSEQGAGELVTLELETQVMGWQGNPREHKRIQARTLRATANDRGFFQIRGIPAGGYVLRATKKGFSPTEISPVRISEGQELALEESLVLQPPSTLELYLEPPVDPRGSPWIVSLLKEKMFSNVAIGVSERAASPEGYWSEEGLDSGTYRLAVGDVHGSGWVGRKVDVGPELSPLFVEIPVVPIEGRITMGDEPLLATLAFGSTQGVREIRIRSGEDGQFEGHLPHEGLWPIDVFFDEEDEDSLTQAIEPVEVRRRPGNKTAVVEIELPNTQLLGEVVSGDEQVPGAFVTIVRDDREGKRREAILTADEEGAFELRGLSPGHLQVHAKSGDLASPWVSVNVQEDLEPPVLRLRLGRKIEVSGQVFSLSGGVVPGAQVAGWPALAQPSSLVFLAETVTAADGSFTLRVPAETRAVHLIVVPPGFATRLLFLPIASPEPGPVLVQVESAGGALVLGSSGSDPEARQRSEAVTVRHNGAALPVPILRDFLYRLARISLDESGLMMTDMEIGEYSLCGSHGCNNGYLQPFGEIVLRPAPPRESTDTAIIPDQP